MKNKNINCFTPRSTRRPIVGDIIFGEDEFVIGKRQKRDESVIDVGMKPEDCIVEETKYEQIISKGFLFNTPYTSKTDVSIIDKTRKKASWVVIEAEHQESLELIHSILPESYRVRAKRLINGEITNDSETIEFYTCGSNDIYKNLIDKKFEVIGTMKF